ncbi:hypothetical protein CDAR_385121 [Caerostris darwini]|uniref:Uncharacterized protein n=1 Tax=Caerostris darwini TaxID=1538125 RepID=A0AAV4WD27_9ARAC|nr:hypothetical protein CDAR_385121 [Caerostris darwini]
MPLSSKRLLPSSSIEGWGCFIDRPHCRPVCLQGLAFSYEASKAVKRFYIPEEPFPATEPTLERSLPLCSCSHELIGSRRSWRLI